jgi:hypothetical protein
VDCSSDTKLHGSVALMRQNKNKRLYNLHLEHKVDDQAEPLKVVYEIP